MASNNSPKLDRPHITFPFQRDPATGKLQVVEQDTAEHVLDCETRIVLCPAGARAERPDFGWPWPMFRNMPIDLAPLKEALQRLEPRGTADVSQHLGTLAGELGISVDVEVKDG